MAVLYSYRFSDLIMAILYPYRFLKLNPKLYHKILLSVTSYKKISVIITDRHHPQTVCKNFQSGILRSRYLLDSFCLWGDNIKGTSKTCQYVPGLTKDRSHPFPSLVTLCSSTIHMVGKTIETGRLSKR